jgi:adenylate kinase
MRFSYQCWPLLSVLLYSVFAISTNGHFTTRFSHGAVKSISGNQITFFQRSETSIRRKGVMQMNERRPLMPTTKVIIAGAPAAGKGTQCEMIKAKFGLVHLSTGDILRAAVKQGTPLGLKAKEFMDGGQLVPDELITAFVCDRLKADDCLMNGWLLDGFPRTKSQAEALLLEGFIPDTVLLLDVPEEILVERVTGRRTDPATGKIYHMKFNPPENDEVASRLVQRSDDTAEKIIVRYREFQNHIDAIKSCYNDKMVRIDGSESQSEVSKCVAETLNLAVSRNSQSPSEGTRAVKEINKAGGFKILSSDFLHYLY